MPETYSDSLELEPLLVSEVRSFCVGWILQVTPKGQALVDYASNPGRPVEARSVVGEPCQSADCHHKNMPVLLIFENGDPTLPIIVGIIRDTLYPPTVHEEVTFSTERPHDIVFDGKKMVFDAQEEIVLRCGKSSVTLRKDGKIVVKGTQIVSRASGTHNIKGASVRIN